MAFTFWRLVLSAVLFGSWTNPSSVAAGAFPTYNSSQATQSAPDLSEEEMKQFLLNAKVIGAKQASKGITRPSRLTLSDGRITHDAGFQTINIRKPSEKLDNGTVEINFVDSYHYNIAAYELARLLDLGHMMPVTVERKWGGKTGSLSWWLKVKMDEKDRLQKNIHPPDTEAWNKQMFRKRVFAKLFYDTDPNLTNVLIGENWELYMIDFSRAFRLREDLEMKADLTHCDRQLLDSLRKLDAAEIKRVTAPHLTSAEIKAVIKRRDKIVAHFEKLVAEMGEEAVLY